MSDEDEFAVPERCEFSDNPIEHTRVSGSMTVDALVREYAHAGFGAPAVTEAVDILTEMMGEDEVSVFMGLAGAMVPGGMRELVADLIRDGYIDVLVTTGANLTHDTIEAIGGHHHHGRDHQPDQSQRDHDEQLREEWVDRIHNVYLPQEHFTALESHLRAEVFPDIDEQISIRAFVTALGKANARINADREIEASAGIAAAAAANDVPIYCPAIQDSILGLQAWMYGQTRDFGLDALGDMSELNDIAHDAESCGAFVVGGGVPKNFVLQALLVTPHAYEYGVQLTMDPPETGGLTGATLDEARSWGKFEPTARNASVYADATITLPLVVAATRERLETS